MSDRAGRQALEFRQFCDVGWPSLEVLRSVEDGKLLPSSGGAEGEIAPLEQSGVLQLRVRRQRFLEVGQQCAAWFTTEGELVLALGRLCV